VKDMERQKNTNNFFPLRVKVLPFTFIALILVFNIGAFTTLNERDAKNLYNQAQEYLKKMLEQRKGFDNVTYTILFHNAPIILSGIIPFAGALTVFTSYYTSGLFISVISQVLGRDRIGIILHTFSFFHTWLELLSASIASTESIVLAYSIYRRRFNQELPYSFALAFLAFSILALAASVETYYIQVLSQT